MVNSVLIAEDHALTRHAICSVFTSQEDFEVCGDAENGREAVEMAQVLHPDLIVLDLSMPGMNGIRVAQALRVRCPGCQILILSVHEDRAYLRQLMDLGVSGYVLSARPQKSSL